MDKFPEAFERFEEDVDVREIRSFRELRLAFSFWAGRNWKDTPRQIKALRVEARRVGIPVRKPPRKVRVYRVYGMGFTAERLTRYGKPVTVYRDSATGRFVKRPPTLLRQSPNRQIRRE